MSQHNRRERENFLRDIERIVNENPALKKKLQNLWLIPPDNSVPEQKIRELNQRAFIACREENSHTTSLAE